MTDFDFLELDATPWTSGPRTETVQAAFMEIRLKAADSEAAFDAAIEIEKRVVAIMREHRVDEHMAVVIWKHEQQQRSA